MQELSQEALMVAEQGLPQAGAGCCDYAPNELGD